MKNFFNRHKALFFVSLCTFIITLAETSVSACYLPWHYEPAMPKCLIDED